MAWDTFEVSENISSTAQTADEIKTGLISILNRVGKVKDKNGKTIFKIREGLQSKINTEITKKGDGYFVSVNGVTSVQKFMIVLSIPLLFVGVGFLILVMLLFYKGKPRKNIEDCLKSLRMKYENTMG